MNRDPLYQKIVERLRGRLDGDLFQQCAAAILGRAHPNLAPFLGGDDGGMDGAFGTPDGPFPLICTVPPADVLGNFRDNIRTYLKKYRGPKLAVVATPQTLSNRKKRNLHAEAEKSGVVLSNIYDGLYFAVSLYRDSAWRLQLLGIPGDPAALSAVPRRWRSADPSFLVGREEDIAWLLQTPGDLLVVGHPGSGKTYLHQHIAREHNCLFAVDGNPSRIADAIRDQEPEIAVVDDAHDDLKLVEELKRLRTDLGARYRIHLNCWPRHEYAVQRMLDIPTNRVRRLQLLRRQEILSLIKDQGILGPDWLQSLIIAQSDGKPGLAVALATACKAEQVAEVWSGEAMTRELIGNLKIVGNERHRCVLAAFAVGGDHGLSFTQVSRALDISPVELRSIAADLGAGGVIEEAGDDRLQVRPPAIRAVLVRDVFFGGAMSPPIAPLYNVPNPPAGAASVLLSARQRGAAVGTELVERMVRCAIDRDIWAHFAWVDLECADLILRKYPDKIHIAAPGLLNHCPKKALHAILDASDRSGVAPGGALEKSRRSIAEWIFPFGEPPSTTIERRHVLLGVLEERVGQGAAGDGKSLGWALAQLFVATHEEAKMSPGSSRQFTVSHGVASAGTFREIVALWPRIREILRHVPAGAARVFFDGVEDWCLPQRLSFHVPVPSSTQALIRRHGRRMLSDLTKMPHCSRAWRSRAAMIASWGKLRLRVAPDQAFHAIFGERTDYGNWEEHEKRRTEKLNAVAASLVKQRAGRAIGYLADLNSEAAEFGGPSGNGLLPAVYHRIAELCKHPDEWLDQLIACSAPAEFLAPFAARVSQRGDAEREGTLTRLLGLDAYKVLAAGIVLASPAPSERLLSATLDLLAEPGLADGLWIQIPNAPVTTLARLLTHPNTEVRGAAAVGEWQRQRPAAVRAELATDWRVAVQEIAPKHYALPEIFESQPAIAFEWMRSQLARGSRLSVHDQGVSVACRILDRPQRQALLCELDRGTYNDELFDAVIADEVDLYSEYLGVQRDRVLKMSPLRRAAGPRWERMAEHALNAGVSPDDLAHYCTPRIYSSSPESLASLLPAYERLAAHSDRRLRAAGEAGVSWVRWAAQSANDRQRWEDTYGE